MTSTLPADPSSRKLLLIGWDSADWSFINPLLDAGQMPALQRLIERGVMGNIASLAPMLSPMLWTSIATGKLPDKHGIHGFIEPAPDGSGVQPVTSTSRRTKALWNITSQSSLRTNVLGWFASHPAEPIAGACVSNLYGKRRGPASLPKESIHPARLHQTLAELQVDPSELGQPHLAPFIPRLKDAHDRYPGIVENLGRILADCASIHNAATWLMQNEPWDVTAIYYEALDLAGHGFMSFHPPKPPHVEELPFELFRDVMIGMYRYHDMMLDVLLRLAGDDTTVMLLSDHGFYNDARRPETLPDDPAGAATWHRPYGIFVMAGPGVRRDERVYGARLVDVTPTALHVLGLPFGNDMDGRVLLEAFEAPRPIERIGSWDLRDGDSGMHPPDKRVDAFASHEAMKQLVELGYIEAPTGDAAKQIEVAVRESRYNLAASLLDSGRPLRAAELLKTLFDEQPGDDRIATLLVQAYLRLGDQVSAKAVLDRIADQTRRPGLWNTFMGAIAFDAGDLEAAERYTDAAMQAEPRSPMLHVQLGSLLVRQGRLDAARDAFERARIIDPEYAGAHYGLGTVALQAQDFIGAVDHLLTAVGLQHHLPRAHRDLGVALRELGEHERAVRALQIAVSQAPALLEARKDLIDLLLELGRAPEAERLRLDGQRMIDALRAARSNAG